MTDYLSIRNWDKFQQYKDGRPMLFIRVDVGVLDDYELEQLSEIQQHHLMKIWLLAGRCNNKIINDAAWIGRKIGAKTKVDINHLVKCEFLVPYESVRDCTEPYGDSESLALEKKRKDKTRKEKNTREEKEELPDCINPETWADYVQHRKEKKQALKPTTTKHILKDLATWHSEGEDVNQILNTSIRNGWTGIFKPSDKRKKTTNGSKIAHVADNDLAAWAARVGAPVAKQQSGYTYEKYRTDLTAWEARQ